MSRPEDRKEMVQEIGVWVLRIVLATGAIVCGVLGKDEASGVCVSALIASFFFL